MFRFLPNLPRSYTVFINHSSINDESSNLDIWFVVDKLNLQPRTPLMPAIKYSHVFVKNGYNAEYRLVSNINCLFGGFVDPTKAADLPLLKKIMETYSNQTPVYLAGCYLIQNELLILTRNVGKSSRHGNGIVNFPVADVQPVAQGAFGKIFKIQGVIKSKFGLFGEQGFVDQQGRNAFKVQQRNITSRYSVWLFQNEVMSAKKSGYLHVRDNILYRDRPYFHPMSAHCMTYPDDDTYLPFYAIFTMRFLPGLTLENICKQAADKPKKHPFFNSFEGRLTAAIEFMISLAYLHAQGVTHCDVSPGNIMIACDEKNKFIEANMIDTGLSRNDNLPRLSDVSDKNEAIGTPIYLAPETLAQRVEITQCSDIFSAGLILCGYLFGDCPQLIEIKNIPTLRKIRAERNPSFKLHPFVPDDMKLELMQLLEAMTNKTQKNRPTAQEVVSKLERIRYQFYTHCVAHDKQRLSKLGKTYQAAKDLRYFSLKLQLNTADKKAQKVAELKLKMTTALQSIDDDNAMVVLFTRVFHATTLRHCRRKVLLVSACTQVFDEYEQVLQLCKDKVSQLRIMYEQMREGKLNNTQGTWRELELAYSSLDNFVYRIHQAPVSIDHLKQQASHMQRKLEKIETMLSEHFKLAPSGLRP